MGHTVEQCYFKKNETGQGRLKDKVQKKIKDIFQSKVMILAHK